MVEEELFKSGTCAFGLAVALFYPRRWYMKQLGAHVRWS